MRKSYLFLALIVVIGAAIFAVPVLAPSPLAELMDWGLAATILLVLAITAFFFEFEAAAISSKEIALVAMLGTIAAVLRVPFAVVPNLQPCTYLIICTGYVFGPAAGFMVGAITALVSNFFLGQGPWTPYQMFAWGLIGVSAAYLGRFKLSRMWLIILGAIGGYVYGWIVNIWFWVSFVYPLTLRTFIVYQLNSIWFDTLHAIGNVIFLALFGMKTIAILDRFKKRFSWSLVGMGFHPPCSE
jgi:energy-coupling factor transport system substrate-specific component